MTDTATAVGALSPGRTYDASALGKIFDVAPGFFERAGGMISSPRTGSLLLITHPGGGRTFDYADEWIDGDLIYTARGRSGDQEMRGENRLVSENSRRLLLFEHVASNQRAFLGEVTCVQTWEARGVDRDGKTRRIFKFRLRPKGEIVRKNAAAEKRDISVNMRTRRRRIDEPRPFLLGVDPSGARRRIGDDLSGYALRLEQSISLREKASAEHRRIVQVTATRLADAGWRNIEELLVGFDLRATAPDGRRVFFEAKTINDENESAQLRFALAQLFEYRFFFGSPADHLCVVTNAPVDDLRGSFLAALDVGVLYVADDRLQVGNEAGIDYLPAVY